MLAAVCVALSSAFARGVAYTGQLYLWATQRAPLHSANALEPRSVRTRIAGVLVRYDRLRGFWRANGRNVWVEAASSQPLLPAHRWARIVRATLATPGKPAASTTTSGSADRWLIV